MRFMDRADVNPLLKPFRQTLRECRDLYLTSAQECIEHHGDLIKESPEDFVRLMDDLHKGLLIKVFVTVGEADRRWSREEQELAEVLFEHTWQRSLSGKKLQETILHFSEKAAHIKWYTLVRPFDAIAPLRNRIGELETIVMRLSNFVAKADGHLAPGEVTILKTIQDELRLHLRPVPLDEPGQHEAAASAGTEAVQSMKSEAGQIRTQCELAEEEKPSDDAKDPAEELDEALADLDGLTGMENIKQEVRSLVNFLSVQRQRKDAGLPTTALSLHMVFTGNPGTGKTTVARIMGRILGAMGILKKGHLIETDRSGLVAEYAGQTGPKTNKKIDEALDGVLFIDEAYSLVAESGDDPYGSEAVQALLKRIEDDRDRLVVILAGYPEQIESLLASNPGLSSRFPRKFLFEDFRASELGQIFEMMCRKNHYRLPAATRAKLLLGFAWRLQRRDEHFGNGRLARNLFESAIRRLANRVAGVVPLTKELLTVLEADDVEFDRVPAEAFDSLSELDGRQERFVIVCPGCRNESKLPAAYLGRRVKCNKCDHRFAADWGEPLAED